MKFALSLAVFVALIICIECSPQHGGHRPRPGRPARPGGGGPKQCGKNEVYKTCGGPCQPTCATYNEPCNIAYIRCPDGCFCRDGFVRSVPGNQCIPLSSCKF